MSFAGRIVVSLGGSGKRPVLTVRPVPVQPALDRLSPWSDRELPPPSWRCRGPLAGLLLSLFRLITTLFLLIRCLFRLRAGLSRPSPGLSVAKPFQIRGLADQPGSRTFRVRPARIKPGRPRRPGGQKNPAPRSGAGLPWRRELLPCQITPGGRKATPLLPPAQKGTLSSEALWRGRIDSPSVAPLNTQVLPRDRRRSGWATDVSRRVSLPFGRTLHLHLDERQLK